ncbi:MAG TPA: MarC family protein [Candidatus Sulfotelmatobacter sp.]|nr:MarC family protein [Candidatus Sulfotelmatobacter sp.]
MAQLLKSTFLILTALFPIVNPLGDAPIFLSLTHYYSPEERRILSMRIAINSFALIVGSYFIGTHILAFFGISLPVVQVGGGLVVAATGWALLKQKDEDSTKAEVHRSVEEQDLLSKAFYPLTLPLTVGPGSISVAITLGANEPHGGHSLVFSLLGSVIGAVLIAASVYLCYAFSDRLARVLGETGMSVIMRLSSFFLVCIGVQIIWNGVSALLKTVPGLAH